MKDSARRLTGLFRLGSSRACSLDESLTTEAERLEKQD